MQMVHGRNNGQLALAIASAILVATAVESSASAAVKTWNAGTSGSWNTAANWSPSGIPSSSSDIGFGSTSTTSGTITTTLTAGINVNTLYFNPGAGNTIYVDAGDITARTLGLYATAGTTNVSGTSDAVYVASGTVSLGSASSVGITTLQFDSTNSNGGSIYVASGAVLKFDANSLFKSNSKKVTLNGGGSLILAGGTSSGSANSINGILEGNLNITNTGYTSFTGSTVNTYSGTMTIDNGGQLYFSKTSGSTALAGDMIINNGGLMKQTTSYQFVTSSNVTVNAGGTWNLNSSGSTESINNLTVNGGSMTSGNVIVNGTATINSGTISTSFTISSNGIVLGSGAALTGKLTLGGDVTFNGSTSGASVTKVGGDAVTLNGDRTFDIARGTSTADLTLAALVADGTAASKLIKTGNGILKLSATAANTYTGGTDIKAGMLVLGRGDGMGTTGTVTVYDGATLAMASSITVTRAVTLNSGSRLGGLGTYSYANFVVGSGVHITAGIADGTNNVGTLTFIGSGGLTLGDGAVLDFDLSDSTLSGNDLISVGALTLSGGGILNINALDGVLAEGTYRLINASGAITGDTSAWSIGTSNATSAYDYSIVKGTGGIDLVVTAAQVPEPASLGVIALGVGAMIMRRRK